MTDPKPKILYIITQSELGGAQKYVYDLARNLQTEYDIAVAFGEQGEAGEMNEMLARTRIRTCALQNLKRAVSPWSDLAALKEIKELIERIRPDIIHLNSSKASILGSLAARGWRRAHPSAKVFYTVHGWVMREPLPAWKRWLYGWAEKMTVKHKDGIIIISQPELDHTVKQGIAPAAKCRLIRHGIDPIAFLPREEARDSFRRMDCAIEPDDIVVYTIGNLYPAKGHEYLVRAARVLKSQGIKLKYIIIGEGEGRDKLTRLISDLNLHRRFFLPGRREGAPLLTGADIFVSSSVKEGLSYTIIEAMQAGLPIIATDVGGCRDLIEDEVSGLVVPPANPEAIALAISKLLLDPGLKKRLGETARRRAQNLFTTARMVKETKDFYRTMGDK